MPSVRLLGFRVHRVPLGTSRIQRAHGCMCTATPVSPLPVPDHERHWGGAATVCLANQQSDFGSLP
jgi:hypothetical protein